MKTSGQAKTLLVLPAIVLAVTGLCGCSTVTLNTYGTNPVYDGPIVHFVLPPPPPLAPRPIWVMPIRLEWPAQSAIRQPSIRYRVEVPNTGRREEPGHRRPEPAVCASVAYDRIVIPQEYAQEPINTLTDEDLARLIVFYEKVYGVDRFLIAAVIRAESDFDPNAVSNKGAQGLMQLMPETAESLGVTNSFDPAQNIAGGTLYLATQLRAFDGDVLLALAAYNAGPESVRKYGGIPPYRETQEFVQRVTGYYRRYDGG